MSISISYFDPLWSSSAYIGNLTSQVGSWEHILQANGGYWTAKFQFFDKVDVIEEWLENGLGRHVIAYGEEGLPIFEGFINKVGCQIGSLSIDRGPLLNIANQVSLTYSTIDTSTNPPTLGVRARTSSATDTQSQILYGTQQKVLSSGGVTSIEADQIRDTYLDDYRLPDTSTNINFGRQNEPSIQCEILGYVHLLKNYVYNQTTNTGTQNASDEIKAILNADPNSILNSNLSAIESNTLQVAQYTNDDDVAFDRLWGIVAQGDATSQRHIFGIYQNRKAEYRAIPSEYTYQQRISAQNQQVQLFGSGSIIKPWNVLPGFWLFTSDLLIGKTQETDLRRDPRALFIEQVKFSLPYRLVLNGGKTGTINQKLTQLGLGGIGA